VGAKVVLGALFALPQGGQDGRSEIIRQGYRALRDCCHHCGQLGHWKAECAMGLLCFVCHRSGHRACGCPARPTQGRLFAQRKSASGGGSS